MEEEEDERGEEVEEEWYAGGVGEAQEDAKVCPPPPWAVIGP